MEAGDLFEVQLREPVATIESMATEEQHVTLAWNADMVGFYNSFVRAGKVRPIFEGGMNPVGAKMHVSRHLLAGALDGVRNRILDLTLQEMGLTPELLTELRAAAKADEEDQGEGRGRWARVRAWFARVATDAGTEAIGGGRCDGRDRVPRRLNAFCRRLPVPYETAGSRDSTQRPGSPTTQGSGPAAWSGLA